MIADFTSDTAPGLTALALEIEARLVRLDRRGMGRVRDAWQRGYLDSSVRALLRQRARVLIVSGFPVGDSFETDGPAGALMLAAALKRLGSEVGILGLPQFLSQLREAATLLDLGPEVLLSCESSVSGEDWADRPEPYDWLPQVVNTFCPTLLVFVEVPGIASDGCHYNMRGANISARTHGWESLLSMCGCPSLAFADGGNELGMGCVGTALQQLDIEPAVASTDHLVIADVSNWGVYGAIALASAYTGRDLFPSPALDSLLETLNRSGIVDGVTGVADPTEDGLPADHGASLIAELRQLSATRAFRQSAEALSADFAACSLEPIA
ncbi:glutamate cyclase domain-containing protein [Microbulbifer guangxiensis]|uniref:glutamate cyclase domain-containing protein n=1 Tax=Microbulbifer guangxiensis TaxID=2904249 RepID=UPI001F28F44B|nr:glutamate cyclase domain-containing protein [Microbulbifer guangxiensis]